MSYMTTNKINNGIGNGILLPKNSRNWSIKFTNQDENLSTSSQSLGIVNQFNDSDCVLDPVSQQITKIEIPMVNFNYPETGNDQLYFEIEDDVNNTAIKELMKFGKEQTPFLMFVNVFNASGEIIEQIKFDRCFIQSIFHLEPLDYCTHDTSKKITSKFSVIEGNLVEDTPGGYNFVKLLETFYKNLSFDITDKTQQSTTIIKRGVFVTYKRRFDSYK